MIKAGIIGSTGYAGAELTRLLMQRDDVEIVWLGSKSYVGNRYSSIYKNMFKIIDEDCLDDDIEKLSDEADVIFTATPQGLCASLVNDEVLKKTKIIDLSADFRFKDVSVYEEWYKIKHAAPQYLSEA
ncbi:MAG: N-acetyl-gamma-glutamyl-phosphate reductase, partial [Lachnospiraceae bacterium]|nr:N-acetyl-gamma-glutamyl-phosphate reductase [Lachnospiraceae bacterium]